MTKLLYDCTSISYPSNFWISCLPLLFWYVNRTWKRGGHSKGGAGAHTFDIGEGKVKLNDFYQFWSMCGSWDPQLPPLLPPLFKFNKFVKYDTLGSFCTKNQVCIIRRSWDQVISILVRSWKNQRFFPTSRLRFCPPFCQSQLKYEIFYFEIS